MPLQASLVRISLLLTIAAGFVALSRGQTFVTVDVPGASSTQPGGVNNSGQIVGYYGSTGFLYSGGSFTFFSPGDNDTYPTGISGNGQIVGTYRPGPPGTHTYGFLFSGGVVTAQLNVSGADATEADGISSNGQYVVGLYETGGPSTEFYHGFVYQGGAYTTFEVPGSKNGTTVAIGVNDGGQIVGFYDDGSGRHGFRDISGAFSSINVPGASATVAFGINNSGEISGYYTDGSGQHGFVYKGGAYSSINVPGATQTTVQGINDSGDVVGYYVDASGNTHGFLYGGVSGYVNPKYLIMGVTYAPPGGNSSSYVSYQNSNMIGNTTTISNSFQTGFSQSVAVGGGFSVAGVKGGVTVTQNTGWMQKTTNTSTVTINKTNSTTFKTPGVPNIYSPVDHDYDIIWLWLNPVALFTLYNTNPSGGGSLVWNGYGYDLNDPLQDVDVWPVYVGYLNGDFGPLDAQDAGALSRSWVTTQTFAPGQGPAITSADYPNILAADPFANNPFDSSSGYVLTLAAGTNPPTSTDGRFTAPAVGASSPQSTPYAQAPPNSTQGVQEAYQLINQTTNTVTHASDYSYTVGFGLEESLSKGQTGTDFGPTFSLDLKQNWTMTWDNVYTTSATNTTTQTDTLQITGPPCPTTAPPCNPTYTEPHEFAVYQDNLYGTFMFWPNPYFSISKVAPAAITTTAGGTASYAVSTLANAGYTGNAIAISVTGLPAGAAYNQGTATAGSSLTLRVTTTSSTPTGSYPLTIRATDGSLSYFAYATLVVSAGVSTTTSLSISPSGSTLAAGASYTLTATVSPVSGSTMPGGNVVFTIGSATQTVALNPAGIAFYEGTAPATAGPLTLSAAYQGSSAFLASTSTTLTATITASTTSPLTITTASPLPSGTVGVPYSTNLAAAGGTPPYTWSVSSGALPAGLTLGAPSGIISGTPTSVAGNLFGFAIGVSDSKGISTAAAFSLTVSSTRSSFTYYFAHIAAGGVWRTTFTFVNASAQSVTCNTSFYSDSGSPLSFSFNGSSVSTTNDTIPPEGLAQRQTDAAPIAALVTGWASANCTGAVMASALFRDYNGTVPLAEASVLAMAAPATRFVTYADQNTGVAWANPSANPASVTFTALDASGTAVGSTNITVAPGAHAGANLGPFLAIPAFQGSITITSSQPIISLSLNADADSPVFSSLPPGQDDGTSGPTTYYFPHLAVSGVWQTTFTFVNGSTQFVNCNTSFYSDSGNPLSLSFNGSAGSTTSDTIPPGGSARRQTDAAPNAAAVTGWASANCTGPVKASALFREYNGTVALAEASVLAMTAPATRFVTYADQYTGVAWANPSASTASVTFSADGGTGTGVGSNTITLAPGGHGSANVGPFLGISTFQGSITITSSQPIISLSLDADAPPIFSSLPSGQQR